LLNSARNHVPSYQITQFRRDIVYTDKRQIAKFLCKCQLTQTPERWPHSEEMETDVGSGEPFLRSDAQPNRL